MLCSRVMLTSSSEYWLSTRFKVNADVSDSRQNPLKNVLLTSEVLVSIF
jgi:hypothetical protein